LHTAALAAMRSMSFEEAVQVNTSSMGSGVVWKGPPKFASTRGAPLSASSSFCCGTGVSLPESFGSQKPSKCQQVVGSCGGAFRNSMKGNCGLSSSPEMQHWQGVQKHSTMPTDDFDLPVSSLERERWARMDRGENRSLSAMDTYRFIGDGRNAFGDQQSEMQQEAPCTWRLKRCAGVLVLLVLADLVFLTVRHAMGFNVASQAPQAHGGVAVATAPAGGLHLVGSGSGPKSPCPTDCQTDGSLTWRTSWSLAKLAFCCEQCGRGCQTARAMERSASTDCGKGQPCSHRPVEVYEPATGT